MGNYLYLLSNRIKLPQCVQPCPTAHRPPPQLAGRAADENIVARRVQHPIIAFARVVVVPGHFDKTFVQTQIVAYGILPALFIVPVVGAAPKYVYLVRAWLARQSSSYRPR
uniref:Uncharacterized protein n=1 Tax=Romanomermis culicivorax TaxID=13658 RepID=A0A915K779_ROMCU